MVALDEAVERLPDLMVRHKEEVQELLERVCENGWGSLDDHEIETLLRTVQNIISDLENLAEAGQQDFAEDISLFEDIFDAASTRVEERREAKRLGDFKEDSVVQSGEKTVQVKTMFDPYKNYRRIADNKAFTELLLAGDHGEGVVQSYHEAFCDAVRNTAVLFPHPKTMVQVRLVFKDNLGLHLDHSTEQLCKIHVKVSKPAVRHVIQEDEVPVRVTHTFLHELVHHYDEDLVKERADWGVDRFFEAIRSEGLASLGETILYGGHNYTVSDCVSTIKALLQPLPEDKSRYNRYDRWLEQRFISVLKLRNHYALGLSIFVLLHLHWLDGREQTKERNEAFFRLAAQYDGPTLIEKYTAVREELGLGRDKLAYLLEVSNL